MVALPALRDPQSAQSTVKMLKARNAAQTELHVLIDDGDGRAEKLARRLRASGLRRVLLLAGGEEVLIRRGKPGTRKMITR